MLMIVILNSYTFNHTISAVDLVNIHSAKIHSFGICLCFSLGCRCRSNGSVVTIGYLRRTRAPWLLFWDSDIMVKRL